MLSKRRANVLPGVTFCFYSNLNVNSVSLAAVHTTQLEIREEDQVVVHVSRNETVHQFEITLRINSLETIGSREQIENLFGDQRIFAHIAVGAGALHDALQFGI